MTPQFPRKNKTDRRQNKKQKAASIRNWRIGQAQMIEDYIKRAGYPYSAHSVGVILRADAEIKWTRDKEAIAKDPNYNVSY